MGYNQPCVVLEASIHSAMFATSEARTKDLQLTCFVHQVRNAWCWEHDCVRSRQSPTSLNPGGKRVSFGDSRQVLTSDKETSSVCRREQERRIPVEFTFVRDNDQLQTRELHLHLKPRSVPKLLKPLSYRSTIVSPLPLFNVRKMRKIRRNHATLKQHWTGGRGCFNAFWRRLQSV